MNQVSGLVIKRRAGSALAVGVACWLGVSASAFGASSIVFKPGLGFVSDYSTPPLGTSEVTRDGGNNMGLTELDVDINDDLPIRVHMQASDRTKIPPGNIFGGPCLALSGGSNPFCTGEKFDITLDLFDSNPDSVWMRIEGDGLNMVGAPTEANWNDGFLSGTKLDTNPKARNVTSGDGFYQVEFFSLNRDPELNISLPWPDFSVMGDVFAIVFDPNELDPFNPPEPAPVPIPALGWLFGLMMVGLLRRAYPGSRT
ncbi:MAG: hypothetical protein KDK91_32255 [Gammaproteobacteria bacterium]|nr:hypothetical protein [Gammaproteobacteria bacterium]